MRGLEQIPWLYDPMCALLERTGMGRWREKVGRGATGRVLDLGCGTGRNLPLLPAGTVGVDPEHASLLKARQRAPSALLVRASAEALPFKPGAFDTVVSGLVFCSVPDVQRGLGEVRRVLKPQGTLRMLEHVRGEGLHGKWHDLIEPAWRRAMGGCHPNRDTESALEQAGYTIRERRAKGTMRRLVATPLPL